MMPENRSISQRGSETAEPGRRQRRNTIILVAVLLLVFTLLYIVQQRMAGKAGGAGGSDASGKQAVVEADGREKARLSLSEDQEVLIGEKDGEYNVVTVKNGMVSVTEANCKNQICVKTGVISEVGEVISCLPHKLIVYIEE